MACKKKKLKVIPLGGVHEIGKNMTVIEYDNEIIVIDCGTTFPEEDMLGVDLVIPDISYLIKNQDMIKAMLLTHGHEDHIGALPYVLTQINAPLYGTRLTLGLVENKLKEHRMLDAAQLNEIKPGETIKIGKYFTVDFIKTSHSIPGAVGLAIHTPVGTIVHTGDFKVDYTPIDGEVIDLNKFAELGQKGVLLLMADSTNTERPGYTLSEKIVGQNLDNIFRNASERIIVASFASNVHRIQQIINAAYNHGRKVAISGRSMVNVINVSAELGYLNIPKGILVDIDDVNKIPKNRIVIITTGSQGEPMSALTRMATCDHKKLDIIPGDLVILSSSPVPGNEKLISRVINLLFKRGANVIYDPQAEVHASGHACEEELKLIHTILKPKFFMPVHGEYRHLKQHGMLAESLGMPKENIFIADIGDVIELTKKSARFNGKVSGGKVLVDGSGIGDVGNIVLRDRKHLSQDGLFVVVVTIAKETGALIAGPDIISRGFVYVRESEDLMEEAKVVVKETLNACIERQITEWSSIKSNIRDSLKEFLYEKTKRKPMILPIIMEI
ncbi:MAG TPA: ribonuclease J [Clostridiales bacterium]|nr:ribonuclease J [Clostridiales bacterium]